ncbi:MAG TPA: ribonuclease H-like domain-containing protein [Dissulfurispiraceae bacterium]|nr:ribonuclease H-like domain-containing protein [Dissulfurispiraceae bacterium]
MIFVFLLQKILRGMIVLTGDKGYNRNKKELFVIRHTFSLLNGIGEKLERSLWRKGILSWDDFLRTEEIEGISPERKIGYDELLTRASIELGMGNARYFSRILKRREHWRLFEAFGKDAVCLDIETNGLQPGAGGYATVVGLYNGYDSRCLVRGENLTVENLNRELEGYRCIITFYGAAFDVPFLLRTFPGVKFDIPHFDLCFTARRLEMNGGLKKLELMLGIERHESVRGMNGYDAVKLWEQAKRGSAEAMEMLLLYNQEDTKHLLKIAKVLYDKMKALSGIEECIGANKVCGCT